MSTEVLALVNYYGRTGYYRHMQTVCNEVLKKRAGGSADPTVSFWSAVGLLMDGSVNEAIRELDGLGRRGDLALPVKLTLLHAHQQCKVVDSEEVARLDAEIRSSDDENASDRSRLQAALVLWHLGDDHSARRQVQILLRLNPQSVQALTLAGHLALADALAEIEANGDPAVHLENAGHTFDQAIAACSAKKDLETLMGKARMHQMREQLKEALECLNQVSRRQGAALRGLCPPLTAGRSPTPLAPSFPAPPSSTPTAPSAVPPPPHLRTTSPSRHPPPPRSLPPPA